MLLVGAAGVLNRHKGVGVSASLGTLPVDANTPDHNAVELGNERNPITACSHEPKLARKCACRLKCAVCYSRV